MTDIFPRKVASMLKQYLIEKLAKLQQRIVIVERFGEHAVTMPMLGAMGNEKLPELLQDHDELVQQINALKKALDAASEADLRAFVEQVQREHFRK